MHISDLLSFSTRLMESAESNRSAEWLSADEAETFATYKDTFVDEYKLADKLTSQIGRRERSRETFLWGGITFSLVAGVVTGVMQSSKPIGAGVAVTGVAIALGFAIYFEKEALRLFVNRNEADSKWAWITTFLKNPSTLTKDNREFSRDVGESIQAICDHRKESRRHTRFGFISRPLSSLTLTRQ